MLALPDRHGFRGTRSDGAPRSFAGRTCFRGVIACVPWPCARVAAWLPAGFELAPSITPRDDHPIVLLFGEQRQPELLRGGLALPIGFPYGELGVFVPYVRPLAGGDLCTFACRMWSTYFPAVWEGNNRYFAKDLATVRSTGDVFVAADGAGRPLVHAVVAGAGAWARVRRGSLPALDAIRDAFALPVLGQLADHRLAACWFDWDFDAASARLVRASIWIDAPLLGAARPHVLDPAADDAVEVRDMTWRLSWPGSWRA